MTVAVLCLLHACGAIGWSGRVNVAFPGHTHLPLIFTRKQIVFADCRLSHSDKSDMVRN